MDLHHRGEEGFRLALDEIILDVMGKFNQVDGRSF